MDRMVEEAFRLNVKWSLQELSKAINGDGKSAPSPLFKVKVVLESNKVIPTSSTSTFDITRHSHICDLEILMADGSIEQDWEHWTIIISLVLWQRVRALEFQWITIVPWQRVRALDYQYITSSMATCESTGVSMDHYSSMTTCESAGLSVYH